MKKRYLLIFLILLLVSSNLYSADENIRIMKDDNNIFFSIKINVKNPKELQKKISSGLSNKIIISIQLSDRKDNKIILNKEFVFEVVYDVWEEKYRLYSYTPQKRLIFETQKMDEIYTKFVNPENIYLCETKLLLPDSHYNFKVRILINPISKNIIEKIKEYLSDPEAVNRGAQTRTIFGSFANTFIPDLNIENVIKYDLRSINIKDIPILK